MKRFNLVILFLFTIFISIKAEVRLPAFFSDGMVLQQNSKVNIWGKASALKSVIVTPGWSHKQYSVRTDAEGNWKISVPTPKAGGPYVMKFNDGRELELKNVLIGEVWICSGQSNMEMPMKGFVGQQVENANMDVLSSANPNIHVFTVKKKALCVPTHDVSGVWEEATPASILDFSATAYYFGRMINKILKVPVGLIHTSLGGSNCAAWMSADMLRAFPNAKIPKSQNEIKSPNQTPTVLYNGMIYPLIGYIIKGVIWYQGESDVHDTEPYYDMFSTLIEGWRALWKQGDFPFYYCQIAPFDYNYYNIMHNSAYLREAQVKIEGRVKNVGMACLMDIGSEKVIHPAKKQITGERLALLALNKTYGVKGIVSECPLYKNMEITNDTVIVRLQRAETGVYFQNGESKLFSLAGKDRIFHPAKAWINRYDNKIFVKSELVPEPIAVRYGFENYVMGDVFNQGLPLSSFRSDDWPESKTEVK